MINLCLGAGYAWSVFQGPLVELFGFSAAKATLAFSISFGMGPVGMILFGPILDKRGPRLITFLGGLLFGLGFIMTSFMKSLGWLYLSYGLISGLGIGMAYGATIATTVTLFPDKRGLASGLNAAGFGSGAIVFAPVSGESHSTLRRFERLPNLGHRHFNYYLHMFPYSLRPEKRRGRTQGIGKR